MSTQTRFKLTLATAGFLALVTLIALYLKMENVALASIAGIMTILSAYIWSQTSRPSQNEYVKNTTKSNLSKNHSCRGNTGKSVDSLDK